MAGNYNISPIRFGLRGLNLNKALDLLDETEASRLDNLFHLGNGQLQVRLGQTTLTPVGGATVNSIARLNAQNGSPLFARLYGADTGLYIGQAAASLIELGFSTNPKIFVPYHPKLSGQPWMLVADPNKNRKVRIDGLSVPLGLTVPVAAPLVAPATPVVTPIEEFAAGFAAFNGSSTAPPTLTYVAGKVGNALNIQTHQGAATGAYTNIAVKAIGPLNLNLVGVLPSTVDDFIHLWLKIDDPMQLEEFRVYLCTANFNAALGNDVPGTDATVNTDAYVKAFRSNDITSIIEQTTVFVPSGASVTSNNDIIGAAVPETQVSQEMAVGRGAWTEFGTVDLALRKSDFQQIGTTTALNDWSAIRGILLWVKVKSPVIINVTIDNMYLEGGYGPDTAESGAVAYTYKVTNYDPRSGAESNGSDVSTEINAIRNAIVVTPNASGDAALRQRLYREGGSLTDDWYFVGTNAGDGVAFRDEESDLAIAGAGTIPVDHFQPVATVDADGNTILAQPLSSLWGPLQGLVFGCGDPYRPGFLYWCIPGEVDHWPVENAVEVCSPTERLIGGCVHGSTAFCFSRERGYLIYANFSGNGGATVTPSGCQHGIATPACIAEGIGGIFLLNKDGIYRTADGRAEQLISDPLNPLFRSESVNGYAAIDMTALSALQLNIVGYDLYFNYQDVNGTRQCLIYSIIYDYWRSSTFAQPIAVAYAEEGVVPLSILMGGATSGTAYEAAGTTDDGVAIVGHWRSGALDQGRPRDEKRYGNLILDANAFAGTLVSQVFINTELSSFAPVTIPTTTGRQRYMWDPFSSQQVRARNISIDLTISALTGSPLLYLSEISSAWEPGDYVTWNTDEINHGISGWQIPIELRVAVRAVADVTLTRTVYDQRLHVLLVDSYVIPATNGVKIEAYVPFARTKGALFQYAFTSTSPFRIYPEETSMTVHTWRGEEQEVTPFGTREETATNVDPRLAAQRPGGAV